MKYLNKKRIEELAICKEGSESKERGVRARRGE